MERVNTVEPVIVAMKGRPYTGKSTIARALAQKFRCPLIHYDDIRASIATLHELLSSTSTITTTTDTNKLLDQLSYDAVFRIASTQLSLHLPLSLVIDSPLSDETHLNRLKKLASPFSTVLYVVECKPQDEFEWRRRVEERSTNQADEETRLYKPSTWEDVRFVSPDYYDDGQQYDVPRILIDTTSPVEIEAHVTAVMKFIGVGNTDDGYDHKASITNEEDGGHKEMKILLDRHPHPFTFFDELNQEQEEDDDKDDKSDFLCSYCHKSVSGPNYSCTECSCILHKSCAESPLEMRVPFYDHRLILHSHSHWDSSDQCEICGYTFNLGYPMYALERMNRNVHGICALIPTNLKHGMHQHQLEFYFFPPIHPNCYLGESYDDFRCHICAEESYAARYGCIDCGFFMHPRCAFFPLKAKHDRHLHTLTLDMAPRDDSDEYYCNACEELRDPDQHVYYCADCEFAAHLSCLIPNEVLYPPLGTQWVDSGSPKAAS